MHCLSQKVGRKEDFADYKIIVVVPVRIYTMNMARKFLKIQMIILKFKLR